MSAFFTSLLIGFLALDTTIAFQVLLSQPIFSCSIIGFVLGDVAAGVEIGLMMQLLWLNIVPVGATVFPEGNIGSMVTCALVIQFANLGLPHTVFAAAFVIGLLVSYVGGRLTVLDRKINGWILDQMLKVLDKEGFAKILFLDIISIVIYFIMMTVFAYVSLFLSEYAFAALDFYTTDAAEKVASLIKPAVWGIGIALSIQIVFQVWKQKFRK